MPLLGFPVWSLSTSDAVKFIESLFGILSIAEWPACWRDGWMESIVRLGLLLSFAYGLKTKRRTPPPTQAIRSLLHLEQMG